MTTKVNVPDAYDNRPVIEAALRPFLGRYHGVHCTVCEPADWPGWIFNVKFPDGAIISAVLPLEGLMQPALVRTAIIRDGLGKILAAH